VDHKLRYSVENYVGRERYPPNRDGRQSLLQKHDHFLLSPDFFTKIDKMAGQLSVVLCHEQKPDLQIIDALEDDAFVVPVFLNVALELEWHLRPMQSRTEVVADVVAVIKAAPVVAAVDAGNGILKIVRRIGCVDEGVLGPIARHHAEAGRHQRDDKYGKGRGRIYLPKQNAHREEPDLAEHYFPQEVPFLFPLKIIREVCDPENEEQKKIDRETFDAVASIVHGAAQIIREIVFNMMHHDVMSEIGLWGFALERSQHPRDIVIQQAISLLEQGAMAGVVHH